MQEVAAYTYYELPEIRQRVTASARLHGAVAPAVHRVTLGAGARCRPPTDAFYPLPRFRAAAGTPRRERGDGRILAAAVSAGRAGIAVLGGHLLGDDEHALRFKAATSMLYGETPEEQELALAAELPHISRQLTLIEEKLLRL